MPLLKEDIVIPDYCFMTPELEGERQKGEVVVNSWFGPAGTVSPLHQDPRRNLLCQVSVVSPDLLMNFSFFSMYKEM